MPVIEMVSGADTPLALRRISPGVSLGDIHRGTDISHSHLSRIFNGQRTPSLGVALRIANFLNVGVEMLIASLNQAQATLPQHSRSAA